MRKHSRPLSFQAQRQCDRNKKEYWKTNPHGEFPKVVDRVSFTTHLVMSDESRPAFKASDTRPPLCQRNSCTASSRFGCNLKPACSLDKRNCEGRTWDAIHSVQEVITRDAYLQMLLSLLHGFNCILISTRIKLIRKLYSKEKAILNSPNQSQSTGRYLEACLFHEFSGGSDLTGLCHYLVLRLTWFSDWMKMVKYTLHKGCTSFLRTYLCQNPMDPHGRLALASGEVCSSCGYNGAWAAHNSHRKQKRSRDSLFFWRQFVPYLILKVKSYERVRILP